MVSIFIVLSVLWVVQSSVLFCSVPINKVQALHSQAACQFAQLPEALLQKIANHCLPDVCSTARVRRTCKFFYATFLPSFIKLDPQCCEKDAHDSWKSIYDRVDRSMVYVHSKDPTIPLSLDLSGNIVTDFMLAKYPVCRYIKNLSLVRCRITYERDNFFDNTVWSSLEQLDLSGNFLGLRDADLSKSGDWYSGANIWVSLCSLPNLKVLCLRDNKLRKLSPELSKCTQLKFIDIRGNSLTADDIAQLREELPRVIILSDPCEESGVPITH